MENIIFCAVYPIVTYHEKRSFLICNTFINNVRLKFAKYQAKAEQQPVAEILLFGW